MRTRVLQTAPPLDRFMSNIFYLCMFDGIPRVFESYTLFLCVSNILLLVSMYSIICSLIRRIEEVVRYGRGEKERKGGKGGEWNKNHF